ncbi:MULTISPECIES: hypothetical protein [Sphingobacterium]|jgi:hypothetical protein|uniref:hypothetical protein n=1 Tax=Sphingobacterium TaxID=28453 RepID=UPI000F9934E0|nr:MULTISPECIES: hypothetical protein [Sphingobacterium]MCS4166158.1 disulfide oxidoreductase YuzD [Sphingobacterium sp. BIGb0116]WON96231.1 hypothetical protein OK025_07405 [Sphingobacterium sp. UGAL515B_05]
MSTVKIEKGQAFWLADPQEHDFPAAYDYLELLFVPEECKAFVDKLRRATTIKKKSKDILRASALPLLPDTNRHVKENLRKIKKKEKLSPILLVRANGKLIIADGYHRLCASYYFTEDLDVPCRLV